MSDERRWAPHVTVAAIVERNGRFLFVEEEVNGDTVINQPAGHWEEGETFAEAAIRECFEETGWKIEITGLVGVYEYKPPELDYAFVRFAFSAKPVEHDPAHPLDEGIKRWPAHEWTRQYGAPGELDDNNVVRQICVGPRPYQDPHPPMYMACTNTDTLTRAGQRGMGALVLGFGGPEDVAQKNEVYRSAWASRKAEDQVGFRPNQHLAALCPTIVLKDGQQARRIGIKGQRYFMESLGHWYGAGPKPDPSKWDDDITTHDADGKDVIRTQFASEKVSFDFSDPNMMLLNPNHAYGTVEDCIGYVQRLIDAGADEILFICQMGTIPQWAQLETLRNIGEHVIPHFRGQKSQAA